MADTPVTSAEPMVVKARSEMCLDGDFHREYPTPEVFSLRRGEAWTVVKRGPRYCNTYIVTSYNEAGLAWLRAHERSAVVASAGESE